MSLNEIDQKAKDVCGNALSLWNDPGVGMFLPIIHWHPASYGLVSFECDTDEHAEQLFQALRHVRSFEAEIPADESVSVVCWQDPIEEAARDLIAKGFVDVTPEGEKCPGYDEEYVFRGPDGMLYHCWSRSAVLNVFAEYKRFGVTVPDGEVYHCNVGSRG